VRTLQFQNDSLTRFTRKGFLFYRFPHSGEPDEEDYDLSSFGDDAK
jgi:hypothetical protein